MDELLPKSELIKHGISADVLLIKFKEQLLKDFEMSNVEIHLNSENKNSIEEIQSSLIPSIKQIPLGVLQQLLYRIDISEKQLSEAYIKEKNSDRNEVIATLIIKRILQKVILKIVYSK